MAIGFYNKISGAFDSTSIHEGAESTDGEPNQTAAFVIGNGTAEVRGNSFRVNFIGETFAKTNNTTGADYAEYFEWEDGNVEAEDRIGYAVSLTPEGKIKKAEAFDDIIGIVSGTAGVVGDSASEEWANKYLIDEFGRFIYETVETEEGATTRRAFNPEYDNTKEYLPRSARPEWAVIGLVGKLYVRDDGTCIPGGYAQVADGGILTYSNERTSIRVMKRTSDNVIYVFMK